jgi:hypothetical protein
MILHGIEGNDCLSVSVRARESLTGGAELVDQSMQFLVGVWGFKEIRGFNRHD